MKGAGVINGYSDETFGPGNYVTRAEIITYIFAFLKKHLPSW